MQEIMKCSVDYAGTQLYRCRQRGFISKVPRGSRADSRDRQQSAKTRCSKLTLNYLLMLYFSRLSFRLLEEMESLYSIISYRFKKPKTWPLKVYTIILGELRKVAEYLWCS